MDFFKQLYQLAPGADITMRIKEKSGIFSISITNNVGAIKDITPIIGSGSPEELDLKFFELVAAPIADGTARLHNLAEHQKSVLDAAETKPSSSKKKEEKPSKDESKKLDKKAEKKPAADEGGLFAEAEPDSVTNKSEDDGEDPEEEDE
jgi:PRTRC genetic system protein E